MAKKKKLDSGLEKIKKRTDALVKQRPAHKDILQFFKKVAVEQHKIRQTVKTRPFEVDRVNLTVKIDEGLPLVQKKDLTLDVDSARKLFKRLCKILSQNEKASKDIERIDTALRTKDIDLEELFKQAINENNEYISDLSRRVNLQDGMLSFLARNSVRPVFEAYANELKGHVNQARWLKGYCPICGSEPLISVLREDGARFLVCSFCGYEWRYKRLQCPFCENEAAQGAKYFFNEKEGRAYRVEVCEKCKRYIKTIDAMEVGKELIPLIEDVGTLHLDIIAEKEGYTRGVPGILEMERMER